MPSLILESEEEGDNIVISLLLAFLTCFVFYKFEFLDWFYYRTNHCKITTTPWVIQTVLDLCYHDRHDAE
jgi:hypothetical protein